MRVTQRGRRSLDVGRTEVFRPRVVFAAAFALTVLDFADRQVVVATFPALRDEWALSDAQLGALVSVVSVTVGIGAFPAALLVDRWSRVRAIALMGMVWSLAAAAAGAAQSFGQLLTARAARDYPTVELGPATGARAAGGRTEGALPSPVRFSGVHRQRFQLVVVSTLYTWLRARPRRRPLPGIPLATAHPPGMTHAHPGRRDHLCRKTHAERTRGREMLQIPEAKIATIRVGSGRRPRTCLTGG